MFYSFDIRPMIGEISDIDKMRIQTARIRSGYSYNYSADGGHFEHSLSNDLAFCELFLLLQ